MAMLKPLGIEKGKPFQPDARQTAILEEAAVLGDAMARNVMYEGTQREDRRQARSRALAGTGCSYVKPSQETETYSQLDERLQYTYGAIYLSPALGVMKAGPGANYIQTFRDKDGNHFDGGKSYRLHVPANPPAAAFWSLTLVRQRNALDGPEPDERRGPLVLRRAHDERRRLVRHVLRARRRRPSQESNWIETVPGRGFYLMFRLYSPTAPLFDGTWTLPDVELMYALGAASRAMHRYGRRCVRSQGPSL